MRLDTHAPDIDDVRAAPPRRAEPERPRDPGGPDELAVEAMYRTMARRHGVIATAHTRSLGVTHAAETGLVRDGVVWSPAAGVLVSTSAPNTWEQRALIAVLAPGKAVLSHGAAARLHGLDGFDRYDVVDVICRKGWWPEPPAGTATHHTRGLTPADVTEVDGIRCLTVGTTLTLLSPSVGIGPTAKALDSALRSGHGIDELRTVATRWRRRGRPGPPVLLLLLDEREGRTIPRSWFQRLARRVLASTGVRLVDEYAVRDARGVLLAELDLAEPRRRVGIECQSWTWHATPTAQHRDARRRGELRRLGWEIVDVWWRDLDRPDRVRAELEYLLRTRPVVA